LPVEADSPEGSGSEGDESLEAGAARGLEGEFTDELREMMRELAAAEKGKGLKGASTGHGDKPSLKLARGPRQGTEKSPSDKAASERSDGTSKLKDPSQKGRHEETRTGSDKQSAQEQAAGAAGGARAARESGGNGAGEVLSKKEARRQGEEGQPQTFSLRLSAVMSNAPTDFEPQQPRRVPASGEGAHAATDPPEVETQAPDDPLHKTEVAPEYEEIVRRVFNRR
jgi:hypothetical protein